MAPQFPLALMVIWGLSSPACDPNGGDEGSSADGSSRSDGSGGEPSDKPNACTDPALDSDCEDAANCPEARCADELAQCYGSGFAAGDYGGACQQDLTCRAACGSETSCDTNCANQCPITSDCEACVETVITPCIYRECFSLVNNCGSSGSNGKTCADLQACCNSLGGADRESCQNQYDTVVGSGDGVCALVYENFIGQGLCQ